MKPLEYERVSVEDVQRLMAEQAQPASLPCGGARSGTAPPEPLAEATAAWLAGLPPRVRPRELPRLFPRIANRLCELWRRPSQCDRYLRELIIDERGHRAGFPPAVATELSDLGEHYATLFPYRHSIWDEVLRK